MRQRRISSFRYEVNEMPPTDSQYLLIPQQRGHSVMLSFFFSRRTRKQHGDVAQLDDDVPAQQAVSSRRLIGSAALSRPWIGNVRPVIDVIVMRCAD